MFKEDIIVKLESIFQIPDDSNRLESYDQFVASLGIVTKPGAVGEGGTTGSKWEVSVQTDQMDDSKKIFFMLPAETSTAYDNVVLFIRYQNGSTDLFVAWDEYLSDNTAVFCRSPLSFIQKIAEHDRLVMWITPYSEGPKTAVFDIRGLKDEVMPYNDDLEWF